MITFFFTCLLIVGMSQTDPAKNPLTGAWELIGESGDMRGTCIFSNNHFAIAFYRQDKPEFLYTKGGKWTMNADGSLDILWEFNTQDASLIGKTQTQLYGIADSILVIGDSRWTRLDAGAPGDLEGAWVITGRMVDGALQPMTPGARKTMKILSGTRFQWIAFNSATGDFFGTGGGTYTTSGGKYTEEIRFFSRDNSRVGSTLQFDFEIREGAWHHSGLSSKGEPIYEIWSTRSSLGI